MKLFHRYFIKSWNTITLNTITNHR
jgi:hypothetical protein